MKYFLIISILMSLFTVSPLLSQTTDTERQTILTINVTNSTANGTDTVNDEVFVTIYEQRKPTQTLKSNVDSQGKAVFENVPTGSNITALPRIKHQNMMFNGHPIALNTGQTVFNGHVEVYEVSTDKSKLSVAVHHFIIKVEAGSLRITEYMRLDNSSDMAITSEERDEDGNSKALEVMLPKGFKALTFSKYFQENAMVITKDGFYDTMATPPGQYDAEFSYSLEIDSETIDIVKKISLPTSEFIVFSLLDKGQLQGLGDSGGEINLADGRSSEYFTFPELKVAEQIKFQIVGLTVTKSNSSTSITLIVVFALIAILVIWRLRSQKS